MDTAYSYMRFSDQEQAGGDTIRRQTALRDAWIARNHVVLDTTIKQDERAVSGFRGKHRKDDKSAGPVPRPGRTREVDRGSYLIVESLDRLTREEIQPALLLVLGLLQAGVRIVQLLPVEVVYDDKSNAMSVMMAIMELTRGNSESRVKSDRVGAAWAEAGRRRRGEAADGEEGQPRRRHDADDPPAAGVGRGEGREARPEREEGRGGAPRVPPHR